MDERKDESQNTKIEKSYSNDDIPLPTNTLLFRKRKSDADTTYDEIPPAQILEAALAANLKDVVVLGYTQTGEEYFASGIASGPEVNWLCDRAKHLLLTAVDESS